MKASEPSLVIWYWKVGGWLSGTVVVSIFSVNLVRKRLVVTVDDEIWRSQLWTLRTQILDNVAGMLGPGVVERLEIRVEARRIPPSHTDSPSSVRSDDADRIPDPLLRHLYRASRRRASA